MPTGKVAMYNEAKGFGFIDQDADDENMFFHISAMAGGDDDAPEKGQKVSYDVGSNPRDNRPRAENVKLIS